MELNVERAWAKRTKESQTSLLMNIQALINRVKLDDKKIRKLEKMNGITWLGDEQKGGEGIPWGEGKPRTAATLYEDRSRWDIPRNCADGGVRQQAFWQGREAGAREMEKEIHGK